MKQFSLFLLAAFPPAHPSDTAQHDPCAKEPQTRSLPLKPRTSGEAQRALCPSGTSLSPLSSGGACPGQASAERTVWSGPAVGSMVEKTWVFPAPSAAHLAFHSHVLTPSPPQVPTLPCTSWSPRLQFLLPSSALLPSWSEPRW